MNFTTIDFETATSKRNSICQVGIVVVENCKIVDRMSYFVKPPHNEYHERNIAIHGITPDKTIYAETFDKVFIKIRPYLSYQKVVAHNAKFDISCLSAALQLYSIPMPFIEWYCTRNIYNASLADACAANGINISQQHDALSDAEACAMLMIKDILK